MNNRHNFVRWFLVVAAVSVACFFANMKGLFKLVMTNDVSGLSAVIAGLFVCGSLYAGLVSYRLDKGGTNLQNPLKVLNYLSDNYFPLGLLGTVIGFSYVMHGALGAKTDVSEIIAALKGGVSTALYTTAVGLVATLFSHIQIFMITYYNEDKEERPPNSVVSSSVAASSVLGNVITADLATVLARNSEPATN